MRNAFWIVEEFEAALCEYTGAEDCVCVDSGTNALHLAFLRAREHDRTLKAIELPRHTYIGVAQAAINAGFEVRWTDEQWENWYNIWPIGVVDSAKHFERGMCKHTFEAAYNEICLSFHVAKRLPLGHGGAILCTEEAGEWYRRARFDGRTTGETGENATKVTMPGYHYYMTPDDAARGLWLLQAYVDQPLNAAWHHYPDISQLL